VHIEDDAANCGACGLPCDPDRQCIFGFCRPIPLEVVAGIAHRPRPLAVDADPDGWVYWGLSGSTSAGAVQRAPKGGGEADIVVPDQGEVVALALDATHVYWQSGTFIRRATKSGGEVTDLAEGTVSDFAYSTCLVADAAHVYWCTEAGLLRVPKDVPAVTAPEPVLEVPYVKDVADDGRHLYVTAGKTIHRVAKGRPLQSLQLANGQEGPVGITSDASNIYWCNQFEVMKLSKSGGQPVAIATHGPTEEWPLYIVVAGGTAYFTNELGKKPGSLVQSVSVSDGDPSTVASHPHRGPWRIVADGDHVYWTVSGIESAGTWLEGAIYRAKWR
jgi:hypothetical protein